MISIESHPKVTEARQHLVEAKRGLADAETAIAKAERQREQASRQAARAIASGQKPKLKASDQLPEPAHLAAAVAEHRDAIRIAEQAEREAVIQAKQDALAKLQQQHVKAVQELSTALEAAAEANRVVRDLEEQAGLLRMNGSNGGLPQMSWAELSSESATVFSKFSEWMRQSENYLQQHSVASSIKRKLRRRK